MKKMILDTGKELWVPTTKELQEEQRIKCWGVYKVTENGARYLKSDGSFVKKRMFALRVDKELAIQIAEREKLTICKFEEDYLY